MQRGFLVFSEYARFLKIAFGEDMVVKIVDAGYKNTYINEPMMLYRDDKRGTSPSL
jgi:hypothetical protein